MEQEYLAFVDEVGRTIEGNYLYRFDYCTDKEIVWGNYFNITPAIIVPNIQPDVNSLSSMEEVTSPKKLELAKINGCFSMQDCIDGIISLCFCKIDDESSIYYNDEPLKFDFGEKQEDVREKLKKCGFTLGGICDIEVEEVPIIESKNKDLPLDFEEVFSIEIGQEIKFDDINQKLYDLSYEKVDYINRKAQYTIRGHIIDIFPLYSSCYKNNNIMTNVNHPYRISFIGNEVEEIFLYDINTQDKIENISKIKILKLKYNE